MTLGAASFFRGLNPEQTIVHRTSQKGRPNLLSLDKVVIVSPEVSSSTSGENSKSSSANRAESTGLTSLNSKFSLSLSKTHHSSENKKIVSPKTGQVDGQSSNENALPPILEASAQEVFECLPLPVPSELLFF